jgi:hypothetical protein
MNAFARVGLAIGVGVTISACRPSTGEAPLLPCAGHTCAISIQNDGAAFLSLRYVDTTGHTTVLGLVGPVAIRLFRVQWVKSSSVRVVADIQKGGTYYSDLALQATRVNELHFPEDFEPVDDLLSYLKPPPTKQ